MAVAMRVHDIARPKDTVKRTIHRGVFPYLKNFRNLLRQPISRIALVRIKSFRIPKDLLMKLLRKICLNGHVTIDDESFHLLVSQCFLVHFFLRFVSEDLEHGR